MKYLLLIYGNQEKWASIPAEEWPEAIAKQDAFNRKYQATGELIGAYGLADAAAARLVRREGGRRPSPTGPIWRPRSTSRASTCSTARARSARCRSRRTCRGQTWSRWSSGRSCTRSSPTFDRSRGVEDLLRELAPQVLAALVRRYGQFHLCEDASQEALLAAALQWPADGIPENPRGWLVTVGSRRLMDQVRSEQSRRNREELIAVATPQAELLGPPADAEATDRDDSLALLFGCCHPELSAPSQIALTLRAVGGLSTAQIAAAFGVPEATMAQRISRAKQTIRESGSDFSLPAGAERTERLRAVLHVLYLIFNEGYTASDGDELTVPALSQEAIRLTRWLHRLLPENSEVACWR